MSEEQVVVSCHHCGQPVTLDQAYLCEFTNPDDSAYTVVFHKGIDQLCALQWAANKMEEVGGRIEAILALFKYVNDGRD